MDENRKLAFAGDEHGMKSYAWASNVSCAGDRVRCRDNVHTLQSKEFEDPFAKLHGGCVRCGKKGHAAVWKTDEGECTRIVEKFFGQSMYCYST